MMVHHLFDASWSVPMRRFLRASGLSGGLADAVLFLPIALLATRLYHWMNQLIHPTMRCGPSGRCSPCRAFIAGGGLLRGLVVGSTNRLRHWSPYRTRAAFFVLHHDAVYLARACCSSR